MSRENWALVLLVAAVFGLGAGSLLVPSWPAIASLWGALFCAHFGCKLGGVD